MNNINDTFFDGYYKQIWKSIIPGELTVKEIDFMVPHFGLTKGSKVLDLMCGYGRHALALGKKGIEVTAVDNLPEYINEVREEAMKEGLPVIPVLSDVFEFSTDKVFDLVICMGNSLNFFDETETTTLFKKIASCLRPGGHLLINTWSIAEILYKNFRDKSWSQVGDLKFIVDCRHLFHPSRIETESMIIAPDGTTESKKSVDYIFSINEMEAMLEKAGLQLNEVYSIPGRKKFTLGEPRAYLVAVKL